MVGKEIYGEEEIQQKFLNVIKVGVIVRFKQTSRHSTHSSLNNQSQRASCRLYMYLLGWFTERNNTRIYNIYALEKCHSSINRDILTMQNNIHIAIWITSYSKDIVWISSEQKWKKKQQKYVKGHNRW